MTRFVVLLRGVNVGGVNMKMGDLVELARGLGYDQVKTVLASGNLILESEEPAATLKQRLQAALRERFGYEAWVQVLTTDQLQKIVAAYPFARGRDGWHDYVMFAEKPEVENDLIALSTDAATERTQAGTGVVYWTVER